MRGGPWHQRLSAMAIAAGCGVVVRYVERDGDRLYNAAVAFGTMGEELAHYRKVQLYGPREKALFTPGDAYATFTLAGKKTALLICYDIELSLHIAALKARGVELILYPTASMSPFTYVAKAKVPSLAANHALTIAYANYCGLKGELTYVGLSWTRTPMGMFWRRCGPTLLCWWPICRG